MPTNPIDEIVRNMPWRLASALRAVRIVHSSMAQVNVAREGYYSQEDLDEIDNVLARLARLARLAARLPPA